MRDSQIPLVLITGFLGSGKTSLINSVLARLEDTRVALLLNDFGSIAVDYQSIETKESIVEMKSLNGGQIFCSCLSGSFVSQTLSMGKLPVDMIVVETSGLAKPSTLKELTSIIETQSEHHITYRGMICVIDAQRYPILSKVVNNLNEQIQFSDLVVINKTDLVDEAAQQQLEHDMAKLAPLVPVIRTVHCNLPTDIFDRLQPMGRDRTFDTKPYASWGSFGRPAACTFAPDEPVSIDTLHRFVASVSPSLLRLKGFVAIDDGSWAKVDAVGSQVNITEHTEQPRIDCVLAAIYDPSFDGLAFLHDAWSKVGR